MLVVLVVLVEAGLAVMTEPRLKPLTPADLDGEQQALFDAIMSGPRGGPARSGISLTSLDGSLIGPFNALLYAPAVGMRAQALGEVARFGLALPGKLAELAILVVARSWAAQFEWWAHARLAADAGLGADVIEAIRAGAEPAFTEEAELLVYAFASELLGPARRVPDVLYRRAVDLLGERQVVELTTLIGYYCLVSAILNTFEVPVPEGVDPPFPEPPLDESAVVEPPAAGPA